MPNIYYVKESGNDGLDGLSEAQAWATITKAFATVAAGDTVYIGPGTYRTTTGWTLGTPGSVGAVITFHGDPSCEHFTLEKPGPVRLTGCDSNDLTACAASIITAKKDYVTFRNLLIGGTNSAAAYVGLDQSGGGTARTAERCILAGAAYGWLGGAGASASDCLSTSYYGFSGGAVLRCVAIGGTAPFSGCSSVDYCLAIGGTYGFSTCTAATRSTAIGSATGFLNTAAVNCLAQSCTTGFTCSTATTVTNCMVISGGTAFSGAATPNELTVVDCKGYSYRTAGANLIGTVTAGKYAGYRSLDIVSIIARALKPERFSDLGMGTGTTAGFDIRGIPTPGYGGVHTPGCWTQSDVTLDWVNYKATAPGVKITRSGVVPFDVYCSEGQVLNVSAWTSFVTVGAGAKPRIVIAEDGTVKSSDTATGTGAGWEQVSCSYTATRNTLLQIWLQAQDTDAGASATFSDFAVR